MVRSGKLLVGLASTVILGSKSLTAPHYILLSCWWDMYMSYVLWNSVLLWEANVWLLFKMCGFIFKILWLWAWHVYIISCVLYTVWTIANHWWIILCNNVNLTIFFIWFMRLLALRPLLAYCASLGWWWRCLWRSKWNVDWQGGKPKFSEKTCPSTTFVHDKIPHDQTRAATVGSRRLTAWAMARP
jgi:hypothetical protein